MRAAAIAGARFYTWLLRWAFERLYREFAWLYDAVAALVSLGRWGRWRRAALPYLRGRVIELGCGTGALHRELAARHTGGLFAVDASAQMLAITRRRLLHAGLPARLLRADARALPLPGAACDTLLATFPSEYIFHQATIAELRRVLRPGGRLVVVLAAAFGRSGVFERLLGLAYRITRQRAPDQPPSPIARSVLGARLALAGFLLEERWEPAGDDLVHLLIATRP